MGKLGEERSRTKQVKCAICGEKIMRANYRNDAVCFDCKAEQKRKYAREWARKRRRKLSTD